ncbi:MAG: exo-beta-N-acetylmuramidase NamZ domain-containing protein [Bacteroidales bacterium]
MKPKYFNCIAALLTITIFFLQSNNMKGQSVTTGLEVLINSKFEILNGKKVGLITNPTGVERNLRSGIDIIFNAPGVKLSALYSPEHGIRGEFTAGELVFMDKRYSCFQEKSREIFFILMRTTNL